MSTTHEQKELAPDIRVMLARLRLWIRAYVWIEGLALALVWLGLTFWVGLALDYLPVLFGASEMPLWARSFLLLLIAGVSAWILYHWVWRRTAVRLADHSMAVLLERRYAGLQDRLVTAVELSEHPDHAVDFREDMLDHTSDEALEGIRTAKVSDVFNFKPVVRSSLLATGLVASIALFYVANASAVEKWVKRGYFLKDEPWPRYARIEVVGVEVLAPEDELDRVTELPLIEFQNGSLKVAKGANLRLKVRADMTAEKVPDYCTIIYNTQEGERGRVDMNRTRSDGKYQGYSFSEKPLRGILSSVRFDVVGYDYRIRDLSIEVVDSPAIVSTELDCQFPSYMVDEKLSLWLPRTLDLTSATQLPIGTNVVIRSRANKPLRRVVLYNPDTKEETSLDIEGDDNYEFEYAVASLQDNLTLDVTLFDTDGVVTDRPQRLFIAAVEDSEPKVRVQFRGIGSAVTADVLMPVVGEISDDYAVDKTWFDVEVLRGGNKSNAEGFAFEFPLADAGKVEASVDFREQRSVPDGPSVQAGDKLNVAIKASDKYDLGDGPNVGSGDRYQLDVVTPGKLLSILEARELGLRRRFEQIMDEMSQARDSLARIRTADNPLGVEPGDSRGGEPGDADADSTDADDAEAIPDEAKKAERAQALRLLRAQHGLQQTRKSAQELLGVAASFHSIREELINNRVDTEDRKKRLKELVADPMEDVGEIMFPELEARLVALEKVLLDDMNAKQYDLVAGDDEAIAAVEQANDVLAELDRILQQMLDLETFNELLDLVRGMIDDQKSLIDETGAKRKRDLLKQLQ